MEKIEGLFLGELSPRNQEKLLALAQLKQFAEGEMIFHEGDPALNLYIVVKGEVALEIHVPFKGRQTLMTIGPGEWFSWSAMLTPRLETASARVVEATDALAIRGGAIMDLCVEDPEFGFQMCRALSQVISVRLTETRLQILDMYAPA